MGPEQHRLSPYFWSASLVDESASGRLDSRAATRRHRGGDAGRMAPAMSFFFGFATIVTAAGIAAPLTVITAAIAIRAAG